MKSRENPRCNIPESQSCDISGNTRKNTFGDKSPVVWNMCVSSVQLMTGCVSSEMMRLLLCVSSLLMQTHVATLVAIHTNTHGEKLGHRFECRHM